MSAVHATPPQPTAITPPPAAPRRRWVILTVLLLLTAHVLLATSSMAEKSLSFDEPAHFIGGYTSLKLRDFRLAESNQLPQCLMALPTVLRGGERFLPLYSPGWVQAMNYNVAQLFLFELGNDVDFMIHSGRLMVVALSVALALLIFCWSRHLFGAAGGLLSLALYAFCPNMIAHAQQMTADLPAALMLLAASGAIGLVLMRLTPARVLLSALTMTALFLTKVSALTILPIAALLIGTRILTRGPLSWTFGRRTGEFVHRSRKFSALLLVTFAHVALAILLVWAFFGFRYEATTGGRADRIAFDQRLDAWIASSGTAINPVLREARLEKWLPEGFLYSYAHTVGASHPRQTFMAGTYSEAGFRWFFPYTVLLKSTFGMLTLFVLGVAALLSARRRIPLAMLWPALTLFAVYWATALSSHLNIGHRHVLPTYPPMFIVAGAAAYWLSTLTTSPRRILATLITLALAAHIGSTLLNWPDYLSYMNALGGPRAQRHHKLVDSSLDWGQDLPALSSWLQAHQNTAAPAPVYLAYFGTDSPSRFGLTPPPAELSSTPPNPSTPSPASAASSPPPLTVHIITQSLPRQDRLLEPIDFLPGYYCLSASILESVYLYAGGPWCPIFEQRYQDALQRVTQFAATRDDPAARAALVERFTRAGWEQELSLYEHLRVARLAAYLRHRQPDGDAGGSILIFKLTAAELSQALTDPPAELLDRPNAKLKIGIGA